jgi:hypothetical protein
MSPMQRLENRRGNTNRNTKAFPRQNIQECINTHETITIDRLRYNSCHIYISFSLSLSLYNNNMWVGVVLQSWIVRMIHE